MTDDHRDSAVYDLLLRRLNRRDVLVTGGAIAATLTVGCSSESDSPDQPLAGNEVAGQAPGASTPSAFTTIPGSAEDAVIVPEGFTSEVLIRWGDPVVAGASGFDPSDVAEGALLGPDAASLQSSAFGTSCDGMGLIPVNDNTLLLCVNHETPEVGSMFPGWIQAVMSQEASEYFEANPSAVAAMRASVGVSVVELERAGESWRVVTDSPLNRRITGDTPIGFSGPAANHPWLDGSEDSPGSCLGTMGNCAAGSTPWGTYLTAEENTNDYFGNAAAAEFEPLLLRANQRFGMRDRSSVYRWEVVDPRFDHAQFPAESMKFGWIVEIDPRDPSRPVTKRTALGRLRHEGATTVLSGSGRPVVYTGDDSGFEYFYKFVSDSVYEPGGDTDGLLDNGTLYVARLDDDGTGQWLPLVYGASSALSEENGFSSQADVVLRCREAADLLGATPLDRPEDVAVHPRNGRVYLACTQGASRGVAASSGEVPERRSTDAANPRGPNPHGHILEFSESNADPVSETFRWEVFVLAGDPANGELVTDAGGGQLTPAAAYYAGISDPEGLSAFANPDNLGFDDAGNLWIVTDGSQPNSNNNGCFMCPTEGADRGRVRQFMSAPVGAEVSGCTFSPDGQTLFLTVQHPSGNWPDGGDSQARSSLIAIRANNPEQTFFNGG